MLFTDARIQSLFTVANFKFYTLDTTPGRNVPTLYFEDAHGIKGRIRQAHPSGPQISYQGNCSRNFVNGTVISAVPVAGYKVREALGTITHNSGGVVGLDHGPIATYNLANFSAFPISDWTA